MQVSERDFVESLEKGLRVIEAFDASSRSMTLSEVANKTGLTRAAARRHLLTLVALKYAEQDRNVFRLAPRVLRLGHAYLSTASLPRVVQPVLEAMTGRTDEVAAMGVLDGSDIVFLARSVASRILSPSINLGRAYPAWCTALGRVLMASRSDAEIERFLAGIRPVKITPKTRTGRRQIHDAILRARVDGYAVIDEELEIGLRSIAIPVSDSSGRVLFGMSLSTHSSRMSAEQMVTVLLPTLEFGREMLASSL